MWTMFFTVPIMAYIMKVGGGEKNGGLSKSIKQKLGTFDFVRNHSPLVDLMHQTNKKYFP